MQTRLSFSGIPMYTILTIYTFINIEYVKRYINTISDNEISIFRNCLVFLSGFLLFLRFKFKFFLILNLVRVCRSWIKCVQNLKIYPCYACSMSIVHNMNQFQYDPLFHILFKRYIDMQRWSFFKKWNSF